MSKHEIKGASSEASLEARIVSSLEDGCAGLDPQVQQRLDQIRSEALDPASERASGLASPLVSWKSASVPKLATTLAATLAITIATAAVVLALVIGFVEPTPKTGAPPMTADLDLLTDPRFELFIEDPEFVAWIAEAEPDESATENSG